MCSSETDGVSHINRLKSYAAFGFQLRPFIVCNTCSVLFAGQYFVLSTLFMVAKFTSNMLWTVECPLGRLVYIFFALVSSFVNSCYKLRRFQYLSCILLHWLCFSSNRLSTSNFCLSTSSSVYDLRLHWSFNISRHDDLNSIEI